MPINFKKNTLEGGFEKALVLGVFFILAGLPILPKVSNYHTFFYVLMLTPVIFHSVIYPRTVVGQISNITKIFIVFSIWSSLSILWSDTHDDISVPIKRSIYILSLFISFSIITNKNKDNLLKIFIASGLAITLTAIYSLYALQPLHLFDSRFVGTGALSNPLLSSHVFGIFSALFIALTITSRKTNDKFIYFLLSSILIIATFATESRTPLVALIAAAIWIAFILKNNKPILTVSFSTIILVFVYILYSEAILSRGLSYRPELWSIAINKILLKPMLGYGFDSNSGFYISSLETNFREPHNIHLSILYFTGIVGFSLWCAMHMYALWACWKNKDDVLFVIASALLVYGITAGMTEGGGLLPRPKEHWFITWIPLAFVSALLTNKKLKAKESLVEHR